MAAPSRKADPPPSLTPEEKQAQQMRQQRARVERYFRRRYPKPEDLEVIHRHAAGIDLGGRRSHFVALEVEGEIEVREFGMSTSQLIEMVNHLCAHGVTSVAMESTGKYWKVPCDLLEASGMEVYLVNPAHAKNVPGRPKTDQFDCRWLQKLHTYGLLSASFRPAREIRPLRSLLRHRTRLVGLAGDYLRRMQGALDEMNVRPHKILADLAGATGMRLVRAIVAGERDPAALARLRDARCQCSEEELREELTGFYQPHLVEELASWLRLYEQMLVEIAHMDERIEEVLQGLAPQEPQALAARVAADTHALPTGAHAPRFNTAAYVEAITDRDPTVLPGIGPYLALALTAELGYDMSRWPTEKHFGSHLTLAPQRKISGGKLLASRTRAGTHPGAVLFRQAAATIIKQGNSALAAFYFRLAPHRGKGKALTALAYKLARLYYHLMKEGRAYVEAGLAAYEEHYRQQQLTRLRKRARKLGYELQPSAA